MNWYGTHIPNSYAAENPNPRKYIEHIDLQVFADARSLLPVPYWVNHLSALEYY